ncbi:hypothetical protein [Corynebacterium phocae]|uniref:hypothetical protein n=1 Tax=Corynebacterium phocae TaxID=161895 RepID=UPI00123C1776|nr:hypothetical protein [Corynebacterium phocae]KAA8719782.1 hypothetical protein F4V58_12330 [Corynebacterium phocae]
MKILAPKTAIAALSIAVVTALSPHAYASEVNEGEFTVLEAVAPAPGQNSNGYAPRSADGGSWAPGGVGATNWLYVKGRGLNVKTAAVAYFPGKNVVNNNACVDKFEIAYYKNGRRVTETAGGNCAPGRVTHTFSLNKNLDAHKPFCGRVRVGSTWGNYACVNIKP